MEIGFKSGIIKLPEASSYIFKLGVDSSNKLYICSLYISIIVKDNLMLSKKLLLLKLFNIKNNSLAALGTIPGFLLLGP